MITYEEYFAQRQRVDSAANQLNDDTLSLSDINCTGLRDQERFWKYAGLYLMHITMFAQCADKEEQNAQLAHAVRILIAAIRMKGAQVNASLFTPDEMEEDPCALALWEGRMADFCRMNPYTFIGYSSVFNQNALYADDCFGYENWFADQLQYISDYCITHSVDLVYIIRTIASNF